MISGHNSRQQSEERLAAPCTKLATRLGVGEQDWAERPHIFTLIGPKQSRSPSSDQAGGHRHAARREERRPQPEVQ
jgi:hypothetical protein